MRFLLFFIILGVCFSYVPSVVFAGVVYDNGTIVPTQGASGGLPFISTYTGVIKSAQFDWLFAPTLTSTSTYQATLYQGATPLDCKTSIESVQSLSLQYPGVISPPVNEELFKTGEFSLIGSGCNIVNGVSYLWDFNPNLPTNDSNGVLRFLIDDNFNMSWRLYDTSPQGVYTLVQSERPQFIEIIEPFWGETLSTTTINTSVRFETPPHNGTRPATARVYVISDPVTKNIEYTYIQVIPANTTENIIVDETIVLTEGSKLMDAYYSDDNGKVFSEVDTIFFNVVTNTYEIATGLPYPGATVGLDFQEDCGFTDVGCQFKRALLLLFYPSDKSLNRFSNIWQTLSYVVPFGYLTVTIDQLSGLDDKENAIFSFGELPFQDAIFNPMRTGIGAILWAIFGIYFFIFRLRHLDI